MDPSPEVTDIGPYHVLQLLGEGGMGTVYLVEQRHPVRRRVALKVLKAGVVHKSFLVRFEAERQALAMMEHSCIAKVLDAGITDAGQPYLAMEYVKGVPITEYCDTNKLSLEERLRLFRDVCSAVQHAHQKGVMHRDLKPSNVLVTVQDGRPMPKVIDFGLAKAVDHRLVEGTLFTEAGQVIGTPEYMSPEQAGIGGLDVDTRTDVYSLGVLLYQLLTGSLPVSRDELLRHGWLEMQRVIREEEPKKPSTRITTLGPAAAADAKVRGLPVADLSRRLRGDLDWIVMKALEKDRQRRFQTAQELAADLQRHLDNEPVTAGPPNARYLLGKLFRKYRTVMMSGTGMVLALAAGLVLALWKRSEAEAARRDAETQREVATRERSEAERLRVRAQDNLRNFTRLADAARLDNFRREAGAFVEVSDSADKMRDWLRRVEVWERGMDDHARSRDELRKHGKPRDDGTWLFADDSQQFLHDQLSILVANLAAFRGPDGTRARVADSARWVGEVRRRTIDDARLTWRDAAAAISTHPAFELPALSSQEGLIPLGADPKSGLQEFLFARSGDAPVRGADGQWVIAEETGIVLVLIPVRGGKTEIGSDAEDANLVESPAQSVALEPYFLGKYEVTQAQWLRLARSGNPSRFTPPDEPMNGAPTLLHPVERVSWIEVTALLTRLGLTLPTEAQWEHACRAGTATAWFFGSRREDLLRNGVLPFNAATGSVEDARFWPGLDDGHEVTAPVGSYPANAYGLFDMHGNVAELTRDSYQPFSDDAGSPRELRFAPGTGELLGGNATGVVHRGGSWWRQVDAARSFARKAITKDSRYDSIGFRVARPLR